MTDTLPPLSAVDLADLKAKAKAASLGHLSSDSWHAASGTQVILRLIDMVERRDAVVAAAQAVIDDVLLAGAIESNVGRLPASPVPPSSTTAKLLRLRGALSTAEPQT